MLDNLLIMWYSSAILNQEVNFMKYVGSKARLSKQLAPIIQSYIGGMGDSCNCHRCHAYELKFQQDGKIKHTAILKEPKANCLLYCRLEDVKEK